MQQTSKLKTRRKYDTEFKNEVVKMLVSGQTAAYISKALGISENLIYRWKNHNQGVKKVSGEQHELALENQLLKDRIRQLETERKILKKARRAAPLSIFSRQTWGYTMNSFMLWRTRFQSKHSVLC